MSWTEDDWTNLSVAVVDDSKPVRSMMKLMLLSLGVGEVLLYENVAEAMDGIEDKQPDLVISDYYMVPETGLDLLKRIRDSTESLTRELPFLMMSGYEKTDTVLSKGISGYMPKPVTTDLVKHHILAACVNKQ
ncbi:response regulator [Kiloniella sp.]|uniref:response regulator n=1 Tax=Kiloniella sp. TaxID=1938587 RepID=UPI003B0299F8